MKRLIALVFLCSSAAWAGLDGGGLTDYQGNGISSPLYSGTRNPVDVDVFTALPAGSNIIGNFRIDQTTAGTTNGVVVNSSALPTGAANATNQTSQITQETATATALGTPADTAATSDTGTFSLISLFKRSLSSYLSSIQNTSNSTASNTSSIVTTTTSIQSTSNSTATNTSGILSNQTNGSQRTLVTDLSGNLQPSGDAPVRAISIKVTDGTTTGAVKAGSTQALLTDTATVVTGRPDNVGTPTQTSVSCAATSTTLLAASTATMFLSVRNPTTSTVTIWINTAGVAAVAAAPSLDLPPGSEAYFSAEGSSFLPTSQINCISGGAASSVTLIYK